MDDFNRRPDRQKVFLGNTQPQPKLNTVEPRQSTALNSYGANDSSESGAVRMPRFKKFKPRLPKNKKEWILSAAALAIALLGGGFLVYAQIASSRPTTVNNVELPPPAPEPVISRLSGRELNDAAINERPIYAVQIENSLAARPQSGLYDADIVFEAIAEGGITRFNAVYQDNVPKNIGPVRSLRPYYIDFFYPFDAAIVHAGGSGEALADVRRMGLKDMDSVGDIMRRVRHRYSPHNYYTTGQRVLDYMSKRKWKSSFTSLPRNEEGKPVETPTASTVNLNISSANYNVAFTYDKKSNKYLRSQGGGAHKDADSGKRISPDVVVVPVMSKSIHPDGVHTKYGTTGKGTVFVFQNGAVTKGAWTKSSRKAGWVLKDSKGEEIKLNPGQTWFTIIDSAGSVSYKP